MRASGKCKKIKVFFPWPIWAKKSAPAPGKATGAAWPKGRLPKTTRTLYHNGGHFGEHSEQASQSAAVIVVPSARLQVPSAQSSVSVLPSFVVTVSLPLLPLFT